MLSILKLQAAIANAETTTQPREQALAVAITLAKDALARSNETIHRFGGSWIAPHLRVHAAVLVALTEKASASDEAARVAAFDKAHAEAQNSDAACYAAQDEAERWEEERMQANCNGRIY